MNINKILLPISGALLLVLTYLVYLNATPDSYHCLATVDTGYYQTQEYREVQDHKHWFKFRHNSLVYSSGLLTEQYFSPYSQMGTKNDKGEYVNTSREFIKKTGRMMFEYSEPMNHLNISFTQCVRIN